MKIILGVCGSISAYKAHDICRGLTKEGHEVKVILTKGAHEFVVPNVFNYLGAKNVYSACDDFNTAKLGGGTVLHIELEKWMDKLLIAPLTANTLSKLANGACDDLLTSLFISTKKTCVLYPAMNTGMLEHPLTQNNTNVLSSLSNVSFMETISGLLACGDTGEGKLALPEEIILNTPLINKVNRNKKVVITTGATLSPIDPVRFVANPASGKTGVEIGIEYYKNGYEVVLICGHTIPNKAQSLSKLDGFTVLKSKTNSDMLKNVQAHFDHCQVYISSAAISDFKFKESGDKIGKDQKKYSLEYEIDTDILKSVLDKKTTQKIIGFAAHNNISEEILNKKWLRKPVDLLIGNNVNNGFHSEELGFNTDSGEYHFFADGKLLGIESLNKQNLAHKIFNFTQDHHA